MYSTQTDLENRLGTATLAQLTNNTAGSSSVDAAVATSLIQRADAQINAKAKNVYAIPLNELLDGTISSSTTTLTGTGTTFTTQLAIGDPVTNRTTGEIQVIASIASDTSATTVEAFTTLSGATLYRIPQIVFTTSVDLACFYAMQRRFSEMAMPDDWKEIGRNILGSPQMKGLIDQIGSMEIDLGLDVLYSQSDITLSANNAANFQMPEMF